MHRESKKKLTNYLNLEVLLILANNLLGFNQNKFNKYLFSRKAFRKISKQLSPLADNAFIVRYTVTVIEDSILPRSFASS
jgi:hypothetical protein